MMSKVCAFLLLVLCISLPIARARLGAPDRLLSTNETSDIIPNQYIVVYKNHVKNLHAKLQSAALMDGTTESPTVLRTYTSACKGAAIQGLSEEAVAILAQDDDVAFIEPDRIVWAAFDQIAPPSWGLDRIDQANRPLNQQYTYTRTGVGVQAYILDSGIRLTHQDFGGRASCGWSAYGDCTDHFGHGTHVAGIIGGTLYGVAKSVTLISVKILYDDGRGSTSDVIAGMDFVRQQKANNPSIPMVVNLSMEGVRSEAINMAVKRLVSAGIVVVTAAGNSEKDACQSSPASAKQGITVGAIGTADGKARYSNFGTCIDLFAPGSSITSAWIDSDTSSKIESGTSMSAPHVAGAAALYFQANPTWTPFQLVKAMKRDASTSVRNVGVGSPNRLLNTANIS